MKFTIILTKFTIILSDFDIIIVNFVFKLKLLHIEQELHQMEFVDYKSYPEL